MIEEEKQLNDIEKQLHEQYAINNNSNLTSVVNLLVAMFAVLGAYGYVYLHSNGKLSTDYTLINNGFYTIVAFLLTAFVTMLILGIMYWICAYQGKSQRKEQFITFAIRYKIYKNRVTPLKDENNVEDYLNEEYKNIFPEEYHPFNKDGIRIVQGLYGEFLKIIRVIIIVLFVSLLPKVYFSELCCCWKLIMCIFFLVCSLCFLLFNTADYVEREDYYKKQFQLKLKKR